MSIDTGFQPASLGLPANEMVIRDESNPRSVINMVPERVVMAIKNLPADLIDQGEPELRQKFAECFHKISMLDERIRFQFWKEYDNAQSNMRQMLMTHVYGGLCSRESFYLLLQNKMRCAWMMCPPVDYMKAAEEALTYGMEQLRDILAKPHTTIGGAVDPKAASVKLEIVKMLDLRVKGAILQTTKNLHVNVNANKPIPAPNINDVDKRIKELEEQLNGLSSGKTVTLEAEAAEVIVEPSRD